MANGLTGKQKKFINAYLLCLNATEAARRAGYVGNGITLAAVGYENLRKPHIKEEIDRIFDETSMSSKEVLMRLSAQARGDIADIIDPTSNSIDWNKARELGVTHLIKNTKQKTVIQIGKDEYESETHTLEVSMYSSQEALKVLAKYHDLLNGKLIIEDWRSQAIRDIKTGDIEYEALANAFDENLAKELFLLAGVAVEISDE